MTIHAQQSDLQSQETRFHLERVAMENHHLEEVKKLHSQVMAIQSNLHSAEQQFRTESIE